MRRRLSTLTLAFGLLLVGTAVQAGWQEGVAALEAKNYDILFLNVVLPGKDGYEVCKAIKKHKDKKHIPVVMLTGKSSSRDKLKGKLSGCDAYLTKPVSLKEFNRTLSKWLNLPLSSDSMADTA